MKERRKPTGQPPGSKPGSRRSIRDLVDLQGLERLFGHFSQATGFTVGLLEHPSQEVLLSTGGRDICSKFHRADSVSERYCRESDAELTERLKELKEFNLNLCRHGLIHGATPVVVGGEHLANLFTGQVLFGEPDPDRFRRQAEEFGYETDAYLEALSKVPVVTEEQFLRALSFLAEMAGMIAEMGLKKIEIEERSERLREEVLEHERMERELKVHRGRLEELVAKRTSALSKAVETLKKEVSERVSAQEKLRQSEERYRSLAENNSVGMWHVTLEGTTIYANPAMAALLELDGPEDILGKSCFTFLGPASVAKVRGEFEKRRQGRSSVYEIELVGKRGGRKTVLVSGAPMLSPSGKPDSAIATLTDITELKRAYRALERAQASAIDSAKRAALGRLTAGASHEILNPLTVISMSLQLLLEDPETTDELRSRLAVMQEQAGRIGKIVRDLLLFSRQKSPERRWTSLNEAVVWTIELLDYDLVRDNIAVELDLAEGLPKLWADMDQLQQVVLNLLTNARDVMPRGGRVAIRTGRVQVEGRDCLELRVEDTGPGLPAGDADKLFEPFFTTKPEGEGTGLGLAICHGIVEAHGGSIWAYDLPAGGAAFCVILPLRLESD